MQRLLVIDDEPALRRAYERMLRASFDVVLAESAEEALSVLEKDVSFEVIICDAHLGAGRSGRQFCEAVAARMPELAERVLLTSGSDLDHEDRSFVVALGRRFLHKPFARAELVQRLSELAA